ncbi:MAG: HEAT repeat domain-containing protein [Verrucomicrobiales bacterium]
MLAAPLLAAALLIPGMAGPASAAEPPVLLKEPFTRGFAAWETTDPGAWRVRLEKEGSGNRVLELHGKSDYEPPHRSPFNIALHKYHVVGDFVLTAKVRTTTKDYGHRDMCVFFGYQDPAHFYYAHLGQETDDHANQIFLVDDAPRTKISEKTTGGTPWKEDHWHRIKVVREVESGLIEVYFDDMETPAMTARDKTFEWGRIGLGSFDDSGLWDDVELRGVEVEAKGAAALPDAKSLRYEKWTPDFQIHNAIALSFDEQGRAYVTGARRRKAQDLAISDREEWMIEDLGLCTVEDKRKLIHRRLAPENGTSEDAKKWVEDFNGDGSHDWRDLTVLSDTIYRIEDGNGDGKADKRIAYATDVKTEITGSMAGVLHHDGEVYATASPDLMKFRDTDGDGVADKRESIASGFGVHVAYAGHYMHGLNVGPDGRIYWSIGDKGMHVTSREGRTFAHPHEGVMMRCEPDGSHFEVFARGQRNIQEPRFDAFGNWFGVDNDGDSPGEMERLVYIAQHMDSGWRINWQYFKGDYNFWTTEGLYKPYFDGQAGHIVPTIANYVNGPSGFAWNPGTALSPEYENYFFITQFASGYQNAFQVEPKGASFAMVNDHVVGNGVPLVGLAWGPDGGLYGTDWGGGYPLNDEGGVWKIDVPEYAESKERKETAKLIREGMEGRGPDELASLCGHADQRVRLAAQFRLVAMEEGSLLARTLLDEKTPRMARIHALWGWAQLERGKDQPKAAPVLPLAGDADPEMRAQFTRTIGDMGAVEGAEDALVALLNDPEDRVRSFAALSLGNLAADGIAPELIAFAENIERGQTYLRHGVVWAMSQCLTSDELADLDAHAHAFVRNAAALALRRQESPAVARFLDDEEEATAADAARAIHDDESILKALPDLAAALEATEHESEAFLRRAVNANFRLGDPESAGRLARYAAGKDHSLALRLDALDALEQWLEPPVIDRIEGCYRELNPRDASSAGTAVAPEMANLLTDPETRIQEAAMRVATGLKIALDPEALLTVVSDAENPADLRREALNALAAQDAEQTDGAVAVALDSDDAVLRSRALRLLVRIDPGKATELASGILESGRDESESRNALATLAEAAAAESDAVLERWTAKLVGGKVPAALHLDVLEAAGRRAEEVPGIAKSLAAFEESRDASDPLSQFRECLEGGDPVRGEDLFMNHIAAQCVRCHNYRDGDGSTIGPNLESIGSERDRVYLLESIVDPQRVIAPGYGAISLTLKNGDVVAGQLLEETETGIEVRDAEGNTETVALAEVEDRSPVLSTMPPMNAFLKKGEIRDLVAYLATLRAKK